MSELSPQAKARDMEWVTARSPRAPACTKRKTHNMRERRCLSALFSKNFSEKSV